ncbi:hypothetical protein FHS57_005915 [Runella defluvii]|jgi:hypothetical protein|uniref:Uncharacterized protein n=1 Tax=Runella defluvii TaxID=370973 RepID=A0A7W5ZTP1_9BACT|nr:hypothetical protein [Runella defluvii]MBB3841886.1 hypothetical protein [Runella defluvii]
MLLKAFQYRNNLLYCHRKTLNFHLGALGLLAFITIVVVVWSFKKYQHHTAKTYVFHPKGASIEIYDDKK